MEGGDRLENNGGRARKPLHLDRHRQPAAGPVSPSIRRRLPRTGSGGRGDGARLRQRARIALTTNVVLRCRRKGVWSVTSREGDGRTAACASAQVAASKVAADRTRLLCASRSSAIAARRMGIASFVIGDYEYSNSSIYRLTRSTILYPDVIDPAPLLASGVRREQLCAVSRPQGGHLIRSASRSTTSPPYCFPEVEDDELVRVLFRPPAERSHYYNPDSRRLALRTLQHLARASGTLSSSSLRATAGRRTSFCECRGGMSRSCSGRQFHSCRS